jgi:formyltetrahydrofolate synthetase
VLLGGKKSEEEIRLHQLLHGPGNFHILVFTSDLLSVTSASKGKDANGILITNEHELKENVQKYLSQWRSKWSYGSPKHLAGVQDASLTKADPIFHIHLIAALPETLSATDFEDPSKIHADSFANKAVGEGAVYQDETAIVHERYGVTPVKAGAGAIVVVRPDTHLGYRVLGAGPAAWQDVDQYFQSILS